MRKYDYEKAKRIIENDKENIASAMLGMKEDWFWTSETIFENGNYKVALNDDLKLGGINESRWATPVLIIEYKNGEEVYTDCYTGEKSGERPFGFGGPITGDIEKIFDNIDKKELE